MEDDSEKQAATPVNANEKWLLVLVACLLLLAYRLLFNAETTTDVIPTVVEAFFYVSGVSPLLVYALAAGLLLLHRKELVSAYQCDGTPLVGLLYLVPGTGLFLWGHFVAAPDLIHLSFILVLFGVARVVSGKELTRLILPLLLMLLVSTPLPAVLINQIVLPLQLQGALSSVWLLEMIGVPSLAVGDMIVLAGNETRFAETCTSIGFILWLTIFALAYVFLFKISGWHAVLLVFSAPLIAYTINILRAFSLVLNPANEVLTIHTLQGIAFFIIGFTLLYAVDTVLLRLFSTHESSISESGTAGRRCQGPPGKQGRLVAMALLLSGLLVASFVMPVWSVPSISDYPAVTLNEQYGAWDHAASPQVRYTFLGSVRYSSTGYYKYQRGWDAVALFVGEDDRLRRNRSLLSGKNAYPDAIGIERSRTRVDLGQPIGEVVSIVTDRNEQRFLTYYWYEDVYSVWKEALYAMLALDQSPFRRDEVARVIRLTTFVDRMDGGQQRAVERLQSFLVDYSSAQATEHSL